MSTRKIEETEVSVQSWMNMTSSPPRGPNAARAFST